MKMNGFLMNIAPPNPESVAGVLFSADRTHVVLILRRDVPVWVLPGGGIEPNEPPEDAVVREILEETGFHVKVSRLVGVYTPINRLARRTNLYECTVIRGTATPSSETKSVQWVPLSAIPPMPPPYPEWVADAFLIQPLLEKKLTSITYVNLIKHALRHPWLVSRFLLSRLGIPLNT
jgi:8-oxo-dGTP diphosphatase